jgi:hypothetical protein
MYMVEVVLSVCSFNLSPGVLCHILDLLAMLFMLFPLLLRSPLDCPVLEELLFSFFWMMMISQLEYAPFPRTT